MADGVATWFNGSDSPVVEYDASDLRLLDAVLMMPGGTLRGRAGVRPGGFALSVGGSPEAVTVGPGVGVVGTSSNADGSWRFALAASVSVDLAARPGAGTSRVDLLVARVYDKDVAALSTALREVDVEVVTGTASASPSAPSMPNGAVLLGTLTVPASGDVVIVSPPRTVAAGGILPVASATERDALPVKHPGLTVWREDSSLLETYDGATWQPGTGAADAWHTFSAAGTYTTDPTYPTAYRKDTAGNVHLRGRVNVNGASDGTACYTLPSGYRPTQTLLLPYVTTLTTTSASGRITIGTDGTIRFNKITGTPTAFHLESVFATA